MAQPAPKPVTIEDALAALKRDPAHPVRIHVDAVDMDVELRAVAPFQAAEPPDVLDGARWEGESAEELMAIIKAGRVLDDGESAV